MDNAIASRNMINGLPDTKVSFNDMVIKSKCNGIEKHPQVIRNGEKMPWF